MEKMMLQRWPWIIPAAVPVEMPVGLKHVDSASCWCEPMIEVDDEGEKLVVHREVTWH
jgi:hypothetical protein